MQKHILFKGRVQGVGFRYSAQRFADILAVKGWVRNLASGDVELVAQGKEVQIEGLISDLHEKFGSNIVEVLSQDSPVTEDFDSFNIRHDAR